MTAVYNKYLLSLLIGFCVLDSSYAQQLSIFSGSDPGFVMVTPAPAPRGVVARAQSAWTEGMAVVGAATVGRIGYNLARNSLQSQLEQALAGQTRYLPDRAQNAEFVRQLMCRIDVTLGATNRCIPRDISVRGRAAEALNNAKILDVNQMRTALKMVHSALVDRVTPAVLRTEVFGNSNQLSARSAYWSAGIKSVVNSCIDRAPTTVSATHCFTNALLPGDSSPLQTNLGTAVVYEMSRKTLEPMAGNNRDQFRACRSEEYLRCMNVTTRGAPTNCPLPTYPVPAVRSLNSCATRAIHNGIMIVAQAPISSTVRGMAPSGEGDRISGVALSTLRACLPGKSSESAITTCFDRTVMTAGAEIVEAKILTEPAVRENFPSQAERQRVTAQAVSTFNSCAQNAQRRGRRENHILSIENCERAVTNHVGRLVVEANFRRQDPASAPAGIRALAACWPGNEASPTRTNSCMRSSIISFATATALTQVDASVPAALKLSQPEFIQTQIAGLQACLGEELPADIMSAQNLNTDIDGCTKTLKRNVAKGVARHEVTHILKDEVTPEQLEAILVSEVDGKFMTCIGEDPKDEDFTRCEAVLRHDVGVTAGALLLPKAIHDYVARQGGPEELDSSEEAINTLVQDLVSRNTTCLGENRARIHIALDECFKGTIHQAVQDIAVLQVRKELQAITKLAPSLNIAAQEARARELIVACLQRDVAADAPLSATISRIDFCGEEITSEMRRLITSEVITLTSEPIDRIFTNYQTCLSLRRNSRRNNCDELMTQEVVEFMRPFKTLQAPCPPNEEPKIDVFDMATAALVSLVQESRGRLDEARAEVQTLVAQFAEIAGTSDSNSSESALVSDSSSDPILQIIIRGLLKEAMKGIPREAGLTPAVQAQMIDPELIREIFTSDVLRQIKNSAARIVSNVSAGDNSTLQLDSKELQMAVARTFLGSPKVMGLILQGQINNEISKHGPLVRWIAPLAAGMMGKTLNWQEARSRRPEALAAEDWVLEQVILPMVEGNLSAEEAQSRQRQAAEMIQAALDRNPRR
jgi:hypothetical protein